MTLALSDADIRAAASMDRIIEAVEQAVREEHAGLVIMPPRANLMRDGTFLRMMPAYLAGSGLFGYKAFHGSMQKGVRYLVVICRESDGEILAMLDAALLTGLRTGATSGLATKYMAPEAPAVVGLIGSGLEATTNLTAVAAVRPIAEVRVYSRNPERRADFARRTAEQMGFEVTPVDSPRAAIDGASIVIAATNTGHNGPVALEGAWLEPGQHVVSIGATSPFLREIDPATFERADVIVLDASAEQLCEECGDMMVLEGPLREHVIATATTLPELVAGGLIKRDAGTISLFKSVGTAAQDLAAAKAIYDVAIERGLGRDLGELAAPKVF